MRPLRLNTTEVVAARLRLARSSREGQTENPADRAAYLRAIAVAARQEADRLDRAATDLLISAGLHDQRTDTPA